MRSEDLLKKYHSLDDSDAEKPLLKQRLMREYERLVANTYRICFSGVNLGSASPDDIKQAGRVALSTAIEKYDVARNVAEFRTYAISVIRHAMFHELDSWAWYKTGHNYGKRISKAVSYLSKRLGRNPTLEELADHLGVSISVLEDMRLEWKKCQVVYPSDTDDDKDCLFDSMRSTDPSVYETVESKIKLEIIMDALSELHESSRLILEMLLDERSLKEIAASIGLPESVAYTRIEIARNELKRVLMERGVYDLFDYEGG